MPAKLTSFKKPVIILAIAGLLVFAVMLLQPLPRATRQNCITHNGTVISISPGSSGDIVIRLKNDKKFYYINRGVEAGLKISDLQQILVDKPVELLTIKPKNPLGSFATSTHIAQVKQGNNIIYTEL